MLKNGVLREGISGGWCFRMAQGPSGFQVPDYDYPAVSQSFRNNSSFYSLENSDITHSTHEDRALAASQQHKEAERRRRERINSHLDKLRTLLPYKASLLAKVVEQVKELKQKTSDIMQFETFPSEIDEISVVSNDNSNDGRLLIKASLCCDDRSDLIQDLIEILKSLRLSPMRAEMVTLGGRIRNVIILAGEKDHSDESVIALKNALRSFIQRSNYNGSGDRPKRRRVFDQEIVMETHKPRSELRVQLGYGKEIRAIRYSLCVTGLWFMASGGCFMAEGVVIYEPFLIPQIVHVDLEGDAGDCFGREGFFVEGDDVDPIAEILAETSDGELRCRRWWW
ncbi:hypothetical protein ACH5RR_007042 [Cinchona calisaya]|uniref:BHLH domain-containing protein n=1 Tax=Cinchona calisaya TaxID=153742 RepID=A0ABD3AQP3_9GENT